MSNLLRSYALCFLALISGLAQAQVYTNMLSFWRNSGGECPAPVAVIASGATCTVSSQVGHTSVTVWAIGGGGGGAGSSSLDASSGGGGGAGGVAYKTININAGLTFNYSIGAGGAGGVDAANGVAGGSTTVSVSTTVSIVAGGGAGGVFNTNATAAGGTYSGGDGGATGGIGAGSTGDKGAAAVAPLVASPDQVWRGALAPWEQTAPMSRDSSRHWRPRVTPPRAAVRPAPAPTARRTLKMADRPRALVAAEALPAGMVVMVARGFTAEAAWSLFKPTKTFVS
ncbi:MAG: hypothetical protein JST16_18840 [Bdellovibrionales bacterium]|nr:hypothetical protein [Bdellovibrionales bacterium]